jgi:hypothetical protein
VKTAVSGLEQEFPGKVEVQNLDATTAEAKQDVQSLGFKNHGLVIRSPEGKVLWKQPDHTVLMDDVRKELRELTKPS